MARPPLPPGPAGLKFWQPRIELTEANWYTLYQRSLTSNSPWGGETVRQSVLVTAYDVAAPATGSQLRVTIQTSSTAATVNWDKVYIGHAAPSGDAIDFDGSQVQLLWSGSASGSITGSNATLTSDPVTYAFDKTRALVISIHLGGSGGSGLGLKADAHVGFGGGWKAAIDEAATTDVTGYTTFSTQIYGFAKVEVYSGPVADSGPVTLPTDAGSYTLTGAATGLGLGYWLTGSDVTFATASAGGTTLAAAAGSYALTGTAAGLVYPTTLAAAAGSYALTGSAIGLGLGYWITGSDVTFATASAGGTTLAASAGSYTLTGSSAGLALRHTAASSSYTLTGSAAALALRHTAGASSYSLTGTAAAYRVTLAAAANSYALTGFAAGLNATANLVLGAAAGAYTITGSSAGFATGDNVVLPTDPGSYALTGSPVAFTVSSGSVILVCGSGSYTLTGFDAALPSPIGPVEPPTPSYTGGASRGRMIRKRRKREEEEEPIPVIGSTPVAEVPPGPSLPPQPSLMAHMPSVQPAKIPKRADPDEEEDEIALLLELIS